VSVVELSVHGLRHDLQVEREPGTVSCDGHSWSVTSISRDDHRSTLEIDGSLERFFVMRRLAEVVVVHRGALWSFVLGRVSSSDLDAPKSGTVRAPIPGVVVAVAVAKDDVVTQGDVLATIESMKTEFAIRAPFAGRVESLHVELGEHVELEHLIAVVRPAVQAP
jgi:acetyl/propionyl-CoA carboxylase alpha subunit